MQPPHVDNPLVDKTAGVTYNVKAYRTLSRQEILMAVGLFHQQRAKRKKLKRGTTITIISLFGLND